VRPNELGPAAGAAARGAADGRLPLQGSAGHSNAVYVAAADRIGTERVQPFSGHSVIVGPAGWPLARPAGANEEATIYAECNLVEARRMKTLDDLNTVMRDRRTDFYDRTLRSGVTPCAP
jgi:N-carbamoylputrescine amidase